MPACRPQQQRRQLTDCAFQWAELQEVSLGEEVDFHDNRGVFAEERNRRSDRKQVKTESLLDCDCVEVTRSLSVCCGPAPSCACSSDFGMQPAMVRFQNKSIQTKMKAFQDKNNIESTLNTPRKIKKIKFLHCSHCKLIEREKDTGNNNCWGFFSPFFCFETTSALPLTLFCSFSFLFSRPLGCSCPGRLLLMSA